MPSTDSADTQLACAGPKTHVLRMIEPAMARRRNSARSTGPIVVPRCDQYQFMS
jgi:hypothetical protein